MTARGRALTRWLLPLATFPACGGEREPRSRDCYEEQPAFRVEISAGSRALPTDTRLTVRYAGSREEEYRLSEPSPKPAVVYCERMLEAGDDAGSAEASASSEDERVSRLTCELWTQGAASLVVQASGYPRVERSLVAKLNECDRVETVPVTIALDADAGR